MRAIELIQKQNSEIINQYENFDQFLTNNCPTQFYKNVINYCQKYDTVDSEICCSICWNQEVNEQDYIYNMKIESKKRER